MYTRMLQSFQTGMNKSRVEWCDRISLQVNKTSITALHWASVIVDVNHGHYTHAYNTPSNQFKCIWRRFIRVLDGRTHGRFTYVLPFTYLNDNPVVFSNLYSLSLYPMRVSRMYPPNLCLGIICSWHSPRPGFEKCPPHPTLNIWCDHQPHHILCFCASFFDVEYIFIWAYDLLLDWWVFIFVYYPR